MSRPLRIEYSDAWYHVMNRGRRRETIFSDPVDYLRFLDLLRQASAMWAVRIVGFCLMPNHYHLLVQTPDANLSRFMRHVDGVYTQRFNRAHNTDGSLFRGRYKAILVDADTYLLEALRYIHRNPIRAGLVTRLDRYGWSSHNGYMSRSRNWSWLYTDFVFSMLSSSKERQIPAYRDFMAEPESDELVNFYSQKRIPPVLGTPGFFDWVKARFQNLRARPEIPGSRLLAPELETIKSTVCANYKIDEADLLSIRRGTTNEARNAAIYLARRCSGKTLATIGEAFGLGKYSSVSSVVSRMEDSIKRDSRLRKRLADLERQLTMSQE
jgi:putative transposase